MQLTVDYPTMLGEAFKVDKDINKLFKMGCAYVRIEKSPKYNSADYKFQYQVFTDRSNGCATPCDTLEAAIKNTIQRITDQKGDGE